MLSKNQIKEIQSLQIKKFRDEKRLFIAEGVKTVLEILSTRPNIIQTICGSNDFIQKHKTILQKHQLNFFETNEDELKKVSLQNNPNQVLAVCRYFDEESGTPDFDNQFSFYLDDIRDPGNFGTIVRLADWFGMTTVYCSPSTCDVYNPKVIQASMGAFLRVKVIYRDLEELLERNRATHVYGALLDGKNLYKEKLKHGLIVIGNEANGINEANIKHITTALTIPSNQNKGSESLNAAMAASIIASEFFRQLIKH
jgi:RNA methyltransferase, TrmH family